MKPMNDKLLVNIFVPSLNETYEMFLPYNEKVFIVVKGITKILFELSDGTFNLGNQHFLINRYTGQLYSKNTIIINTDIRSGADLILL